MIDPVRKTEGSITDALAGSWTGPGFATIDRVVEMARSKLPQNLWDFFSGGADSETTLRRNRAAWDKLTFRPRILVDVSSRDTATEFLGEPISLPVMLAPVGSIGKACPDAALSVARVAQRTGTVAFVSSVSAPKLEDIRAAVPDAKLIFQIYIYGDARWTRSLLERAEQQECMAICLTVDSAVYGRRERDLRNGYKARERERPNFEGLESVSDDVRASVTWGDLARMRDETKLPFVLKGVLSPEDAELAVRYGVDTIYVSNHGGRQLDHGPGTADVVPEIIDVVGNRATVIVDGGVVRGTDVVKALALGARATLIGKLQAWALAAAGEEGLEQTLALMQKEISTTMGLLGAPRVSDIRPALVQPTVTPIVSDMPWSYFPASPERNGTH